MRHGFKSIAGSAGDDRRRERERERERGTRASNQDELLTTGRGGGKRDPRPSVCRPWDAFVSCKKRGVKGRREGGGVRVLNALAHVELSNAASVRPGPAALALNSTGVGRGQRKGRGRDRHRVKSLQAHSSHSSLALFSRMQNA